MTAAAMLRPKAKWLGEPARSVPPAPTMTERAALDEIMEHAHVIGRGRESGERVERGTWLLIWISDPVLDWLSSYWADGDDDGGVDTDEDCCLAGDDDPQRSGNDGRPGTADDVEGVDDDGSCDGYVRTAYDQAIRARMRVRLPANKSSLPRHPELGVYTRIR